MTTMIIAMAATIYWEVTHFRSGCTQQTCVLGTIIILILELTSLRYREAKVFAEPEINPDTSCSRAPALK